MERKESEMKEKCSKRVLPTHRFIYLCSIFCIRWRTCQLAHEPKYNSSSKIHIGRYIFMWHQADKAYIGQTKSKKKKCLKVTICQIDLGSYHIRLNSISECLRQMFFFLSKHLLRCSNSECERLHTHRFSLFCFHLLYDMCSLSYIRRYVSVSFARFVLK